MLIEVAPTFSTVNILPLLKLPPEANVVHNVVGQVCETACDALKATSAIKSQRTKNDVFGITLERLGETIFKELNN